jgi:hypothetical protein
MKNVECLVGSVKRYLKYRGLQVGYLREANVFSIRQHFLLPGPYLHKTTRQP